MCGGGGIIRQKTRLGSQWKIFSQRKQFRSDRNTEGVKGTTRGRRGGARKARSKVVAGGISMLGRRLVTTRWEDYPRRRHVDDGGVV